MLLIIPNKRLKMLKKMITGKGMHGMHEGKGREHVYWKKAIRLAGGGACGAAAACCVGMSLQSCLITFTKEHASAIAASARAVFASAASAASVSALDKLLLLCSSCRRIPHDARRCCLNARIISHHDRTSCPPPLRHLPGVSPAAYCNTCDAMLHASNTASGPEPASSPPHLLIVLPAPIQPTHSPAAAAAATLTATSGVFMVSVEAEVGGVVPPSYVAMLPHRWAAASTSCASESQGYAMCMP